MIAPKHSALLVACVLAAPAVADVTITQTMDGKALGLSGQAAGTTYIKGNKMRSDAVLGNRTHTTIFDLDAQKMYAFDSRKKQADVWDMAAFAAELTQAVDLSSATGSLRPNGQTKQIAGQAAAGYDFEMTTAAGMAGAPMTVTMTGPIWIVEGAPGSADYGAFYAAAAEKGWIFSDPRAARAAAARQCRVPVLHRRRQRPVGRRHGAHGRYRHHHARDQRGNRAAGRRSIRTAGGLQAEYGAVTLRSWA